MQAPENAPSRRLGRTRSLVRVLHLTSKRTVRPFEWPSLVTVQFPFGGFSPAASGTMMVHGAIHRWGFLPCRHPTTRHFPRPCAFSLGGHHRPDRGRRPVFRACAGQAALPLGRHAVNARFLGGFYTAEMVVMAALLVWNRWSPGRLVLVMAFIPSSCRWLRSSISAISTSGAKRPGSGFWSILLRSRYPGCSCGGPGPVLLQKA